MAQRKTLNEKQLAVLRWIADGCPDGVMEDDSHRISAASLRRRDLVKTSGRGSSWTAEVTASGGDYLKRADGPNPPIARQASTSVTEQLVNDVVAAGGSVRLPRKRYYAREGVDYENRALLAERYGKVPEGKRLAVSAVSPDELQIELVDELPGASPRLESVPVPEKVARYHPVVRRFKQQSERHEVSRAALPRVLRILQGLVVEAERRGHEVELAQAAEPDGYRRETWSGKNQGHLVISVNGCATAIRVREEGLQSRTYWEKQNRSYSYRLPGETKSMLPPLTEYEASASGRIGLELVSGFGRYGRPVKWADRQSWTLEEKLPELLRELEIRAVERASREREAERQAADRQREWEAALQRARELHAEARRGDVLRSEVGRWRDAREIRAYCDAAESAYPDAAGTGEWVAWARSYADQLDPLDVAPGMPAVPESVPPEELRPYLDGWDPYGPSRRGW